MFLQLKFLVTIIIILIIYLNGNHCAVIGKPNAGKSSMVLPNVNSMEVSTKINPTLPLIPLNLMQQYKTHLIPQNTSQAKKTNREGKFFSDLSFLTGLGIGSLATSAIIPTEPKLSHDSAISTIHDQFSSNGFSSSTNNLLSQAIKSMQQIVEKLKRQTEVESSSPFPLINNEPSITLENSTLNELNKNNNTSGIRVFQKNNENLDTIKCSNLRNIIRETIKEHNFDNEKRQATPTDMSSDATPSTTTETAITTTRMPQPHSNTTTIDSGYYYGGNPQNISGINLSSHPYPSTSYGYPIQYPHGLLASYSPQPIYDNYISHEYYQPENIGGYLSDSTIISENHLPSIPVNQWPSYLFHSRANNGKFLKDSNAKLSKGFIPSRKIE